MTEPTLPVEFPGVAEAQEEMARREAERLELLEGALDDLRHHAQIDYEDAIESVMDDVFEDWERRIKELGLDMTDETVRQKVVEALSSSDPDWARNYIEHWHENEEN